MSYIFTMAMRNLGRNHRRTLLALASIFLALLLITILQGFIAGILDSLVRNYTKNETGHVRITTEGFQRKLRFMPVTENIQDPDAIIAAIRGDPALDRHVRLVAPRIEFGVLLSNGGNNKTALAVAGDPEAEKELLMLHKSIRPGGRYITGSGETVIGATLAETLGLREGGILKVMTTGADYGLHLKKFTVVGIFSTGVNSLDGSVFQIPLADARELLRAGNGVQQILVMLDDYRYADRAEGLIRARLDADARLTVRDRPESGGQTAGSAGTGLSVMSWTRIGDYPRLISMAAAVYRWIFIIIAFLGAFIITNIMMMVVLERRKEIGILKSMGMPGREILALFLVEGSLIGLVGSILGVGTGFALTAILGPRGFDFTEVMRGIDYPMDNVIHPAIAPGTALTFVVLGTVVASIVSIAPARRAARMNAIDAIRSV